MLLSRRNAPSNPFSTEAYIFLKFIIINRDNYISKYFYLLVCGKTYKTSTPTQILQQQSTEGDGGPKVGVGALLGVVAPLLQQMLVDGRASEGGGHELKVSPTEAPLFLNRHLPFFVNHTLTLKITLWKSHAPFLPESHPYPVSD